MKKMMLSLFAIFTVLCICAVVFQIKNPPLPDVLTEYTEHKAQTLLYRYAYDAEQTASPDGTPASLIIIPMRVTGMMIEYTVGEGIYEYYFRDIEGKIVYGISNSAEITTLTSTDCSYDTVDTDDFSTPSNSDYDTPQGDEVKIYLNTTKGTRLLSMTQAEFDASPYKAELDEMKKSGSKGIEETK